MRKVSIAEGEGEERGRGGSNVRFESVEAERSESQSQVAGRRVEGEEVGDSDEVERPVIEVGEAFLDLNPGQSLSVVHGSFGGIVSKHSVDQDD